MKLVSFEAPDQTVRLGALSGEDTIIDLTATAPDDVALSSMQALIDAGDAGLQRAEAVLSDPKAISWPLGDVGLLAPLPLPVQIRCFSAYEAHYKRAIEASLRARYGEWMVRLNRLIKWKRVPKDFYERPFYYKANRFCVAGPGAPIVPPPGALLMDYEAELAFVIGKTGKNIEEDDAMDHVFGYMIYNDVTARGLLAGELSNPLHAGPAKGKDFDGSHIFGPVLVTADEIEDPYCRKIRVRVNGVEWGKGDTDGLTHSVAEMIAYASAGETLQPGEIFGTGACEWGTGFESGRFPPAGSLIEIEIEGIGVLGNPLAGTVIPGPSEAFAPDGTRNLIIG